MTETKLKQSGYKYVDTFCTKEQADTRVANYRQQGYDAKVVIGFVEDMAYYRVFIKEETK